MFLTLCLLSRLSRCERHYQFRDTEGKLKLDLEQQLECLTDVHLCRGGLGGAFVSVLFAPLKNIFKYVTKFEEYYKF